MLQQRQAEPLDLRSSKPFGRGDGGRQQDVPVPLALLSLPTPGQSAAGPNSSKERFASLSVCPCAGPGRAHGCGHPHRHRLRVGSRERGHWVPVPVPNLLWGHPSPPELALQHHITRCSDRTHKGQGFSEKKKKTPKMPLKRFSLAAYGGNTAPRFVLSSCQQETPRSGCSPISSSCVITPRN